VSWPGREPEFRDSVDIAVCIAERLGTRAFNALYGNRAEGTPAEEQDEVAVANLAVATAAARRGETRRRNGAVGARQWSPPLPPAAGR